MPPTRENPDGIHFSEQQCVLHRHDVTYVRGIETPAIDSTYLLHFVRRHVVPTLDSNPSFLACHKAMVTVPVLTRASAETF